MPTRETPYPLPDPIMLDVPPPDLATSAVRTMQLIYGVTLDYTPESLARLDAALRENFRSGRYTRDDFPAALVLTIGAYIGEVFLRTVPGGHWGQPEENLYDTPLPFLIFSREQAEMQINVVGDFMNTLWSGKGLPPSAYFRHQLENLKAAKILY